MGGVVGAALVERVADVFHHGVERDHQLLGDLTVRLAGGQQLQRSSSRSLSGSTRLGTAPRLLRPIEGLLGEQYPRVARFVSRPQGRAP
jgi:hypothetical protein